MKSPLPIGLSVGTLRGTQSIAKAMRLLCTLSTRTRTGWRIRDLAETCGLDEVTVRRMLNQLRIEGAVVLNEADRRYRPGPLLFALGLSVTPYREFAAGCQSTLDQLAASSKAIALLYLRLGDEFVCIGKAGSSSEHWPSLHVGTRRSLGMSVGGLAILLALPAQEQEEVTQRIENFLKETDVVRLGKYRRMHARSSSYGVGVNMNDALVDVTAIAVPLFRGCVGNGVEGGQAFASIGITARSDVLPEESLHAHIATLKKKARILESNLASNIRALDLYP